jgi:hypothetical protein
MEDNQVTVSLGQVARYNEVAEAIMQATGGQFSKWSNTLRHGLANTKQAFTELESRKMDLLVDCASVDADGNLKKDAKGNYLFTPEKEKEFSKKMKAILAEEVKVKTYHYTGTDLPKGVNVRTWDIFAPFSLPELTDAKVEEILLQEEETQLKKTA